MIGAWYMSEPCDDRTLMCTKCGDPVMVEVWCVQSAGILCRGCGETVMIKAWVEQSVVHCDDWGVGSLWWLRCGVTEIIETWCGEGVETLRWLRPDVWGCSGDWGLMCTVRGAGNWGMTCTECGNNGMIEARCVRGMGTVWWLRPGLYKAWGHCDNWGIMCRVWEHNNGWA